MPGQRWVNTSALGFGLVLLLGTTSGCVTTLGYVPENLKPRNLSDKTALTPTYTEVKAWAYDVHDGYDSRATMNRYAAYFGALFGVAAAGATAGLAAFDAGASAIKAIPLGGAFFAGTAAVYNHPGKADLYQRAALYVKALIDISDQRLQELGLPPDLTKQDPRNPRLQHEATCLKMEVDMVMGKVQHHLTMMEPQNVVAALSAIANGQSSQSAAPGTSGSQTQPDKLQKMVDLLRTAGGDLGDLDVSDGFKRVKDQVQNDCGPPKQSWRQDTLPRSAAHVGPGRPLASWLTAQG